MDDRPTDPRRIPDGRRGSGWLKSEKPWWFPGWPSIRDVVTSVIALGLLAYTGYVLAPLIMSGNDDGLRHAREAFAILGTAVGAVLGFYFGAGTGERVARQATQQATDAVEDKAVSDELLSQLTDAVTSKIGAVEKRQERLAQVLRELQQALEAGENEPLDGEADPLTGNTDDE